MFELYESFHLQIEQEANNPFHTRLFQLQYWFSTTPRTCFRFQLQEEP